MSINPYPQTRGLFSEEYYQHRTEQLLQPDFSEYSVDEAEDLKRRFKGVAQQIGMTPGKLLTAAMVTAVLMGEGSTEILEND